MKKNVLAILFAICATLMCIETSCKKDDTPVNPTPSDETTLVGKWISYKYAEIDEEGAEYESTREYSVLFNDSTVELSLDYSLEYDNISTIISDYSFKETDESIIYFQKAFTDYGYKIVGKFYKTEGQLVIEQTHDNWDWISRYYFVKE